MTPEQTLDWLAEQHFDQCREERSIQDWIRKMKVRLPAQPEQETQAYREAAQLAKWLFKTHYAQEEHYASGRVIWGLSDTTAGVISQIDNMVCKLVLPKEQEPVAWLLYKNNHRESFWLDKGDAYALELTPEHRWEPLYTTPPQSKR